MRSVRPCTCAPLLVVLLVIVAASRPAGAAAAAADSLATLPPVAAAAPRAAAPARAAFPAERVRLWQTGVLRADRLQHGSLSMTLALAGGVLARKADTGLVLSLGLGLAKELYDSRRTGFDPIDLVADALGAGIGAGAAATVLD